MDARVDLLANTGKHVQLPDQQFTPTPAYSGGFSYLKSAKDRHPQPQRPPST